MAGMLIEMSTQWDGDRIRVEGQPDNGTVCNTISIRQTIGTNNEYKCSS